MSELYIQDFGKKNIVSLVGWDKDRALLEDLFTGLKYTYDWKTFFKYHVKLEDLDFNVEEYEGTDLSSVL
jgi:hypothetical protein